MRAFLLILLVLSRCFFIDFVVVDVIVVLGDVVDDLSGVAQLREEDKEVVLGEICRIVELFEYILHFDKVVRRAFLEKKLFNLNETIGIGGFLRVRVKPSELVRGGIESKMSEKIENTETKRRKIRLEVKKLLHICEENELERRLASVLQVHLVPLRDDLLQENDDELIRERKRKEIVEDDEIIRGE